MSSVKLSYERQIQNEKTLKIQAINKLAEVMNRRDPRSSRGGDSSDVRRKDKENRKLHQDLRSEREKLNSTIIKFQKEINDLQGVIAEESQGRLELQLALDSRESDIERLRCQLSSVSIHSFDATSIGSHGNDLEPDDTYPVSSDPRLEGWLAMPSKNSKRFAWDKKYVVVSSKKILFYNNEVDKEQSNPFMVLDIDKLFHVRPVTQTDVYRADVREIPRIFQILYANEGECKRGEASETSTHETLSLSPGGGEGAGGSGAAYISHKGHELVPTLYHFPSSCEACTRPLWHVFKPPPALECRRCHTKCHREHLDRKEEVLAPCRVNYDMSTAKDLLLLASSQSEQQCWVRRLLDRIPRKPVATLPHPAVAAVASPPSNRPRSSSGSSGCPSPAPSSPRPSPKLDITIRSVAAGGDGGGGSGSGSGSAESMSPRLSHRGAIKVQASRTTSRTQHQEVTQGQHKASSTQQQTKTRVLGFGLKGFEWVLDDDDDDDDDDDVFGF
ncbi:rho-associated protein kinase 2-like [Engraulis encrasicolus]|uniref:rho-associated protein kinase 2-like n=1 Tax=Engraulis encrasicolus TaxID=184585 RepID=UPI002FD4AC4E